MINGDGNHSRDFTFVANAVQANIKSLEASIDCYNQVYNIACGHRTTLNEVVEYINEIEGSNIKPVCQEEREGDIKHSLADISKAKSELDYKPEYDIKRGLEIAINWYRKNRKKT